MKNKIKNIVEKNLDIKINSKLRTNQASIAKCIFYNLLKKCYHSIDRKKILVEFTGKNVSMYYHYEKTHRDYVWKEYVDYYELCEKEFINELECEFEEVN